MSKHTKQINKVGGWVTQDSEVVYENPWIRVNHENVLTPKGTQGIYGLVHFKNHAIGIIPVDEEGNTWLVKQSRYALNQTTWEIPEGGALEGEGLLAAAKRELEEETGLCAKQWQELLIMHQSNSVTDEVGTVYVAKELYSGKQALEDTEDIEVKKVSLLAAVNMVMTGEITDSLSVAGLLKLAILEPGLDLELDLELEPGSIKTD